MLLISNNHHFPFEFEDFERAHDYHGFLQTIKSSLEPTCQTKFVIMAFLNSIKVMTDIGLRLYRYNITSNLVSVLGCKYALYLYRFIRFYKFTSRVIGAGWKIFLRA